MEQRNGELRDIARLFGKLGFTAFGGPAAHIAMMREAVVHRLKWMDEQHFLDLLGATNLIPGPNSTEMAIHIGYERGGWKGLLIAGGCFIFPAVFITAIFAWFYKEYGQLPEIQPFVYGIQPAIIAVILGAIVPLARQSLKTAVLWGIGVAALALTIYGCNEIYVLFGAGFLAVAYTIVRNRMFTSANGMVFPLLLVRLSETPARSLGNLKLFLVFLKIGAILYGSGYVLFAFLDSEFVATGLLSLKTLIDAIAVGQFTPGPVFSSVTFVGYQINGGWGAVVATIGIFLPSFVFVALLNPLVKRMRNAPLFALFLDAVNVASVAIILAVCYSMGKATIVDWRTIAIAIMSTFITIGFRKVNSAFIVAGGAILGYLLTFL